MKTVKPSPSPHSLQTHKPKTFLIFVKSSFGEIFVILPTLYFLKKQDPEISLNFIFETNEKYKEITQVTSYINILNSLGKTIVGVSSFIRHMLLDRCRSEPLFLLSCDNGIETLQRVALSYFSNSIPIFFHHAYALHARNDCSKNFSLPQAYIAGSCVLASNKDDLLHYQGIGFDAENIFFVGAQGYRKEWLNIVTNQNPYASFPHYKKIIFVPTRPAHAIYLTEHNYQRQLSELALAAEKFQDYLFAIKAHPRQTNAPELQNLTKSHSNILTFKESTLELAAHADLTISFWSSAILDSIAVNTPVVEFHYHEIHHSQLATTLDNSLQSLYVQQGFCPKVSSLNEIIKLLESVNNTSWFEKYSTHFKKIFGLQTKTQDNLTDAFDGIHQAFIKKNCALVSTEKWRMRKELTKTLVYLSTPRPILSIFKSLKKHNP